MTETLSTQGPLERMTPRSLAVLLVLCGAAFLEGIDVAMFTIALPAIRSDLGMSSGDLQWVVSAYILGYGGFMLLGGRVADLYGRRRVFILAMCVFLVFSGLGGFASEGWVLILARAATGISAAFLMPAGLSIITTTYAAGHERDRALLIYAGVGAGGFSIGLVAGGLLTLLGWRWVFFAPVAFAAILLVLAIVAIPKTDHVRPTRQRLDVLGAVTITTGLVLLVWAIERAVHAEPVTTVVAAAAGLALLGLFVLIERRSAAPLVQLALVRTRGLVRACFGAAALAGGFLGFQFVVVLYLQETRGWTSLQTSLALLVLGIDTVLAPLLTPRLVRRFGHTPVIVVGFVAAAASFALFLPVSDDWGYLAMFPSFLALGLAFTLAYGPLTIAATEHVDAADQGVAGALLYTAFQIGGALGLAATSAAFAAAGESGADATRIALIVPLAIALITVMVLLPAAVRARKALASE
jgi:MFS family permease